MLLALAALSAALLMALVSCGGGEKSPAPAATSVETASPTPVTPTEAPTEEEDRSLTVYSGRSQSLVNPLLEAFGEETGISIRVKYASSASTAATLLEEGDNTPADVVFLQDPGSLGSLAAAEMLGELPQAILNQSQGEMRRSVG